MPPTTQPSLVAIAWLLASLPLAAQQPTLHNIDSNGIATANTITAPAKPGSMVRLTLAGQRPPAEIHLGNTRLHTTRSGANALTFRIPQQAPRGCYVPLHLRSADSIPIAIADAAPCQLPSYQFSEAWIAKRTGIAARVHSTEWAVETGASASTVDVAAAFFEGKATIIRPGSLLRFPPPGYCSSQQRTYKRGTATIDILLPMLIDEVSGLEIDGGEFLNVDDGRYQVKLPRVVGRTGLYWKTVASTQQEFQPLNVSGVLNLRIPGGAGLPATMVPLPPPAAFEWAKRPSGIVRVRSGVDVQWHSAGAGTVLVSAIAVDPGNARFAYCLCVAPPTAAGFQIPGQLLHHLIDSTSQGRESVGAIYLIHIPDTTPHFPSSQMETSAILSVRVLVTKVLFRR